MTEDELKQFTELAAKFEPKDKEAVTKLVQTKLHPVFQDINDGGRTAAMSDMNPKLKKAEEERDSFKTRAEKAEGDLKELEGKAPDAVKLREKFEKELTDERKKFGEQLEGKDREILTTRMEVAKGKLVDRLADKYEVDREYAGTVLVNRQDVLDRLQVDKASPVIKVLKAGSKDMFIVPAEGREPLDHLAEELAEGIADKWKGTKIREGSGTQDGPGGSGKGDQFEQTRERVKSAAKEREESRKSGSGIERLTGRRQ